MDALLEKDEESDSTVYAAYLRAQSDADLLDIGQHLDPERYPARVDAVRREGERRFLLPLPWHSTEERFIRGVCVVSFAFSSVLALLTILLTANDAAGPRWLNLDQVPAGTPASELMRQGLLGILRAISVDGLLMGIAPLILLTLGGWLAYRLRCRAIRLDVKQLVVTAIVALCAALLLAAAPFSHIPDMPDLASTSPDFWTRFSMLIWPW